MSKSGTIKHRHQTVIASTGADVDKDTWNDSEVIAGATAVDGDVMIRDSTQGDGWGFGANVGGARDTFANRATADGKQGLFLPTDGYGIFRDRSAGVWDAWGPNFPFTKPVDPGTWVNQGTSTIASSKDALVLTGVATGNVENIVARVGAVPATPWTLTMYCRCACFGKNNAFGLLFRESSTGKIHVFDYFMTSGNNVPLIRSFKYTSAVLASATYQSTNQPTQPQWLRIQDDGGNRVCSVSDDGQNWVVVHTITRLDFLLTGADQYGFFVNTQNAATPNLAPVLTVLSLSF